MFTLFSKFFFILIGLHKFPWPLFIEQKKQQKFLFLAQGKLHLHIFLVIYYNIYYNN